MRLVVALLMLCASNLVSAAPQVLTSIKPLQLIAAAITHGVSEPQVLLGPGASPHNYALKPSDAHKIQDADLVFWVGPNLETFLQKPLEQLSTPSKTVALIESKRLHLRQYAGDKDGDEPLPTEGKPVIDPHIWLSPVNADAIASIMMEKLIAIDGAHSATYKANYQTFSDGLKNTDEQLKASMSAANNKGYLVLHDGYGYFEEHYGLANKGAITISPERQPGAKHLAQIENQLKAGSVVCVFNELQFAPHYLDELINRAGVRRGTLDYLATNTPVSAQGYGQFLQSLGQEFLACLTH